MSSQQETYGDQGVPQAGKKAIPYWVKAVILFFLGWIFMYATRNILSASMSVIQAEFSLSGTQLGLLNSVFFLVYTIGQIPSGAMGDKFGLKLLLVIGVLFFGVFTGLTGIATSFTMLLIIRGAVGLGQATYYGPQYALSSNAIPLKYRSFGSAIINSGMAFGISLGLIGAGFILNNLGLNWRYNFYIFAIPTIVVGILIQMIIREKAPTEEASAVNDATEQTGAATSDGVDKKLNKNIMAIYVMVFCSLFGFFVTQTWLPYYLEVERGIARSQVGFIASLLAWASIPGALIFSRFSDKLKKRKPFVICLVCCALISIVGCVASANFNLMVFFIALYGFTGKLAMDPILVASLADNAPIKNRGTIFSAYNFVGMSASVLAPYIAGWLSDATGSVASAFYLSGILLVIGVLTFFIVFRDTLNRKAA